MSRRVRLNRTLKPASVWAIALGTIIGWGCFILPGGWLHGSGPLGAVLGLTLGAAMMLFIGKAYGFMIRRYPVAGGEFAYAYKGFGRNDAYLCGWFLVLTYLSIIPLNATAFPIPINFFTGDQLAIGHLYTLAGWSVNLGEVLFASGTLIVFGYLNYRGVNFTGSTQLWMVILMVGSVGLLLIGSLVNPEAHFSNLRPLFAPEQSMAVSILLVLAIAPWAYMGFDTIPQAAEEFGFSEKQGARLIPLAIVCGCLMYVLVLFCTAIAFSWPDKVYPEIPNWLTGESMRHSLGHFGVFVLMVGVLMGILTGINGFYLATSRLIFCMGRARVLPPWFARVHPKHHTPGNAILFVMLVSLITPWFGREIIFWIVNMSAVGMAFGYGHSSFSAYKLSKGEPEESERCIYLVGGICSIGFIGLLCVPGSPVAMGKHEWIALGIWIALGAVFYAGQAREYRSLSKEQLDHLILDLDFDEAFGTGGAGCIGTGASTPGRPADPDLFSDGR